MGIPEKQLWKKLRAFGWLYVGTYKDDPYHNTARRPALLAGYLTVQTRGYPAPYNKNVTIMYNTTLITKRGIERLNELINPDAPPLQIKNEQPATTQPTTKSATSEREKAISLLSEWNLYQR